MKRIIEEKKSIIPAADLPDREALITLLNATLNNPGIGAIKLGMTLGLKGLEESVKLVKDMSMKRMPVIFDYQKAGNDIPKMGRQFARDVASAGCDAAILFPFAGPATQEAWTTACMEAGLIVLIGGILTIPQFLISEGGYVSDEAPELIFRLAAKMGVRHFVVPGNKLYWVVKLKGLLDELLGEGNYVLYAPGFFTQRGDLSECGLVAGPEFHGIIGDKIYGADDKLNSLEEMRAAADLCTSQLLAA